MTSSESWRSPRGYAEICDLVRVRLARGELRPGDRLPPIRALATELGVNVNTVARAYAELAREGILVARAGGGTRVARAPRGVRERARRAARLRDLVGGVVLQALGLGFGPEQIEAAVLTQLARWQSSEAREPPVAQPAEERLLFVGSHDLTLDLLAARLARCQPPVLLSARFDGSLDGLVALARDEAHLAGCHLLDALTGEYNAPFVARLLPGQPVVLVTLAQREQGLLVRAGNPRRVRGLADLARPDLVVAARQRGSGTRVLLEHALRRAAIPPHALQVGPRSYPTHLAVAAAIADGDADVGLAIRGAAQAYGLEFLPLATERYELAITQRRLGEPAVGALLQTLEQPDFRRAVRALGGYDVSEMGQRRLVA